jgi:hypothetical protein
MVRNLVIKGNSKMGPNVGIFNLPAKKTCTPTHWCLKGKNGKPACYALRNNFQFPSVIAAAKERLRLSRRNDFVNLMAQEINQKKIEFFRWHSSGDFYSESYVQKVSDIVAACPDTLFRTTTRRRDLTAPIVKLAQLPNIIVRESLDDERPTPEMGLPFAAIGHLDIVKQGNSYECQNLCPKCDYHCWKEPTDMHFQEH